MKRFARIFTGIALLNFAVLIAWAGQVSTAPYQILKSDEVGGPGGWDYITADVPARRLYVPRSGANAHLSVYDLDTLAPVGQIPISCGGAAIDPVAHHGFCSTQPITMFDTRTLEIIKTIPIPNRPDGMMFDPYNERVWVSGSTVIDAKTGTVVGTVELGGRAEQDVSNGKGIVYVNITDKSNVAVVDANTLKVITHYDLSSKASNAGGLSLDVKNHVLFSYLHVPRSMVVILNADNGSIITTLPVGEGVDTVAFNPDTMEALSTDGASGTFTVIKENSPTDFVVEQTLKTMQGARTMVLDTETGHVATVTADVAATSPAAAGGWPQTVPNTFRILLIGRP